jgi:osmoprotectant transport system ATP-binding protein
VISLVEVSKRYPNGRLAVDRLTIDVPEGELVVLVGPSGCGKTTVLRMINRLIDPSDGTIYLDRQDVTTVDAVQHRRRIGYVIQQVGLFPHLTIAQNVGTVPRLMGWSRPQIRARSDELLALVGLDPAEYRDRYPSQLSGGEQQRIGVARALAADPPVLLMDEPFGAIDPITRARLQDEFLALQHRLRKTVLFVTHDIEEAVKLGDRIAILGIGGNLEQYGAPADVLGAPASDFVASFVGGDRALKRLKVTRISADCLASLPTLDPRMSLPEAKASLERERMPSLPVVEGDRLLGRLSLSDACGDGTVAGRVQDSHATVDLRETLDAALARTLLTDDGWVAVCDGDRFVGVLTPETVHRTLRESLDGGGPGRR